PWAQSTTVTRDDFFSSRSANCLNSENSWVALDMLIETSATVPSLFGLPSASRGWILAVASRAAFRCFSGGSFLPPPYSPPSSPLYRSSADISVSGLSPTDDLPSLGAGALPLLS